MPRKRLGELLVERSLITPAQLSEGLSYQRQTGHRLGAALVALGFLSESLLCEALAHALGLKAVSLPPEDLDWEALHLLRGRFCEANDLFPLAVEGNGPRKQLVVAMADPLNIPAIEEIEFTTGMKVKPVIAPMSGIRASIRRYYLKQQENPVGEVGTGDKMMVVHRGGELHVYDHANEPKTQIAQLPSDEELPLLDAEAVLMEEVAEVTSRTALANLMKERETRKSAKTPADPMQQDLSYLFGVREPTAEESLASLERKFWALLRIMAKKGLITKEEFMKELDE